VLVIAPAFVGVRCLCRFWACLGQKADDLRELLVRQPAQIVGSRGLASNRTCLFAKFTQRYEYTAQIRRSSAPQEICKLGSECLLMDLVCFCKFALKRCVRCERAVYCICAWHPR